MILMSVARIVGGSCLLAKTQDRGSYGLWAAVLVCEAIAILVVVFLMLDLLERV